jgi:hypothetical protein
MEMLGYLLFIEEAVVATAQGLFTLIGVDPAKRLGRIFAHIHIKLSGNARGFDLVPHEGNRIVIVTKAPEDRNHPGKRVGLFERNCTSIKHG